MRYLLILILIFAGCSANKPAGPDTYDRNKNDANYLFRQGVYHIKKRMPEKALKDYLEPLSEICKKTTNIKGKRVMSSTNKKEAMYYTMKAASENVDTIVQGPVCGYGYYMMTYAYLELRMKDKALITINKALELSPANSEFLSEQAYIYQISKNWEKSLEIYKQAEKMVEFSPDSQVRSHLGRALRGQGYSLIEMGRLDEAEEIYKKCLRINKNDRKAYNELRYINKLRNKG